MKRFDYYLDGKYTVWQRTYFSVEAETSEEAESKIKQIVDEDDIYDETHFVENEILFDTLEIMSVDENDGQTTQELFNSGDEMIWDNTTNKNNN
jgi:hypothetical protein